MRGVGFRNCIPQCPYRASRFLYMRAQHGDGYIRVIINLDFALVFVETMQAAYVLLQRTFPRDRRHKQKRVSPR